MTNELDPNVYIDTFLSRGPKFYAYRVIDSMTGITYECCKVKVISLNYDNSWKINFDSIKNLIESYFSDEKDSGSIKINFRAIKRMPAHVVVTRDEFKTCCIVLKRRYLSPELGSTTLVCVCFLAYNARSRISLYTPVCE